MSGPANNGAVLSVRDLHTYFYTDQGIARAVDGVSFDVCAGKTLAVVGESGCGKSVTALSIMRLIPQPPGRIAGGEVWFNGVNLLSLSEARMRGIRGDDISMIFQEPMTSMNPVFRIGHQIGAVLRLHRKLGKEKAREEAIALLERVGIPEPARRVDDYPHQLSGGMLQRVMIAMALACSPKILIADEPTTALDVTIQAQILELLKHLQRETGMALLLITHDLGVVAETADDVVVMYAGKTVEQAPVEELFAAPKHPYTRGLFASLPGMHKPGERLYTITGSVPAAIHFPSGCRFHPRCPYCMEISLKEEPRPERVGPGHTAACWLYNEDWMKQLGRPVGIPEKEPAHGE
ncbi:MAG: ABC transporter ATP-binding protein [Candidatus Hydrogenedentes bacterium]|nr:ABC transporter ATP-binding protein [Candidatus Hydrogenedentota bacterium]